MPQQEMVFFFPSFYLFLLFYLFSLFVYLGFKRRLPLMFLLLCCWLRCSCVVWLVMEKLGFRFPCWFICMAMIILGGLEIGVEDWESMFDFELTYFCLFDFKVEWVEFWTLLPVWFLRNGIGKREKDCNLDVWNFWYKKPIWSRKLFKHNFSHSILKP